MSAYLNTPVIFLGFGRSGTTIISEIVFQHPDLAWLSNYQAKFPKSKSINILRNLFENKFWKLRGQKNQLNDVLPLNKYLFMPSEPYSIWNELTRRDFGRGFLRNTREELYRDEIRHFFNRLVAYQNRKRLAFKITGPSRLEYLNSLFPDARYIWIQRAPLPNIRSLLKVDFYQDRKHDLWWKGEGIYSEAELDFARNNRDQPAFIAALQYFKIHQILQYEKEEQKLTNRLMTVYYENFIESPSETVKLILSHLQLSEHPSVFKHINELNIYNRNKKEDAFISRELDKQVREIALHGIQI